MEEIRPWDVRGAELRVASGAELENLVGVDQTPVQRLAIRARPPVATRPLFLDQPLPLPAVVVDATARTGEAVDADALASKVQAGSMHRIEWLVPAADGPQRQPALWLAAPDEAALDGACRTLDLAPGLHIDETGQCTPLGTRDGTPRFLVPLPRIVLPRQWLLGDNTDPRLSMDTLLEGLLTQFQAGRMLTDVRLASGFLYRGGLVRLLRLLARKADPIQRMRLLFSGRTDGATALALTPRAVTQQLAEDVERALEVDPDVGFAEACRAAVQSGRLEVRVYPDTFLHAKLFVGLSDQPDSLGRLVGKAALGSSNLSHSGLGHGGNLELDAVLEQPEQLARLAEWFDRRWEEAVPPEPSLLEVIEAWQPPSPPTFETPGLLEVWQAGRDRTLRAPTAHLAWLAQRHADQLDAVRILDLPAFPDVDRQIDPSPEQIVGVEALRARLLANRIAFLADSVGLGKTITALGTAWSLRRAHAITDFGVLAPRKLHEQWAADAEAIGLDPNSFSRLNRHVIERKPLEDAGLEAMLGRYQLLLVDEAHETLRNRRNKLWEHLNHWLRGDPDRMVLLISATPWNNSREDIYNYLAPAWVERTDLIRRYPGLGTPAIARTLHLYDPIDSSHARDFGELDQTTYNQLFGAVFVQRTRHQIARIYGSDAFPTRRVHADATPAQPEHAAFFQQLARTLGQVQIAYREPFSALLRALNPDEATGQSNLHRSFVLQLYKRAESSLFALAVSLAGVERRLREFRRALEVVRDHSDPVAALRDWLREVYLRTDQITDAMEQGDDDDALLQVQHSRAEDNRRANVEAALRDLDAEGARAAVSRLIDLDVNADLDRIDALKGLLTHDLDEADPNALQLLATTSDHVGQRRKVILVAAYADTAVRMFRRLVARFPDRRIGLALGGGEGFAYYPGSHRATALDAETWQRSVQAAKADERRQLLLTAGRHAQAKPRASVLAAFAPKARSGAAAVHEMGGELEILVGSEAISVGQNLQDATVLVHLDLPWNPMVVEQRIGRVDRRGGGRLDPQTGQNVVDIHYCWSAPAIEAEVTLQARLFDKAEGAMRDTRFDELLFHELTDAVTRARQAGGDVAEAARAVLDQGQADAIAAQTRVEGTSEHSGAGFDGHRRLAAWRKAQPSPLDAPSPVVACVQRGQAEGPDAQWLISVELRPLGETGATLGGAIPANVVVAAAGLDHPLPNDLDGVVRSLTAGAPAGTAPGLRARAWIDTLKALDASLQRAAKRTLAAHNAQVQAQLLARQAPRRRPSATDELKLAAREALEALEREAGVRPELFEAPAGIRLLEAALEWLEPQKVHWLVAGDQDPQTVRSYLLRIKSQPRWAATEAGQAALEEALFAPAREAAGADRPGPELPLQSTDRTWSGLRVEVQAATLIAPSHPGAR